MTPPFNRRELLKLAGAGVFSVGGLSTEAGAQSEESEIIETDLVRVAVPTTAGGSQTFVEKLARNGEMYVRNINPALRDETGNTLNSTEVFSVDRRGNTVEVNRRLETSASTLDSTLTVTVPEGVPGTVIDHTVENIGDEPVELNTPDNFIGTDIGLGDATLASPGDEYRFSVQGGDPISYDEVIRWDDFDLPEPRAWATSFDDERAVTYGLDGPSSASDPKLAMIEGTPPSRIWLFGTLVILEPGESATWRTAAVAHDGDSGAPSMGGSLIDDAFDSTEETATVLGSIRDEQDAIPLGGITVSFLRQDTGEEFTVETAEGSQRTGEYSIDLPVDEETEYEMQVDPDGYQTYTETLTLTPDETVNRTIELSNSVATVSGTVRDKENNNPLIGVTLEFTQTETGETFTVETGDGVQGGAPGEYSINLPVDDETTYEIAVDPDAYKRFTDTITLSTGDNREVIIRLDSDVVIVLGSVRDEQDDTPLGGITLRFTRKETGEEFTVETAEGSQRTGEYRIELPVDGETNYTITTNPSGYRMFEKLITLSPDDTVTETIELSPVSSIDIEEVRPVQVVFDAGPAADTVELVGGKSTAVFVVPEIGDIDRIPDDAEIEIKCISDRFGGQWSGDLVGQTLTLDKADLEAFEEHDGETFGEVPSIPQFPITGDISGPTGIDVATGDLGVAVGDADQIDGGAATTFVNVVDIDPIHITFYRDTGKSFLTQPDLDEVQPEDYAEHVEEAVRYLTATLPIAAADLSTTVGPTFTPRRPGASQGATLTLEAIEEAHGPSGTIPAERTWSVGIYSDDTKEYWDIGSGRTKADGLGPEYRAVLVRNQNYLTTAHEFGHQFGLHNGTEEYKLPPSNDGEQTTNGYWVDEGEFFDTAASFMQSPNKGFTATSTSGWWPSNAIDYTADALDYDVMMWKLSEGRAGVAPNEFDANGTATGESVGSVELGDINGHAVDDRLLYAKGLIETDHSEADPGELGDVLDADTDRWHVYTDETLDIGPEPATGIATIAVVARDSSGDQVAERKTRVVSKFCGGQTGRIDRDTDPYYAVPVPYPRTAVQIELREIEATGQVQTSDNGLVSAFDPRVEVLRGELDSIPDTGFRADDPETIEDTREGLHGIIDDVEASYDAGDNETAAEAIRTQLAPALDDALKDDYEANEPFERSRQSVETAIDDTVDRSLDGPPPLPGQDAPPQDLDGDGRFEDVNGDGQFTVADVQVFFQHRNSDPVRNNPAAFNFDGDDPAEVSVSDVQALFIDLVRGTEGVSVEDVDVSVREVFDGDPAETLDGALEPSELTALRDHIDELRRKPVGDE